MSTQHSDIETANIIKMLAHQWRQPLSVISMSANNILADIELSDIDKKTLEENIMCIIEQTQELSKTMDDFVDFYKPKEELQKMSVTDIFNNAYKLMEKSFEEENIKLFSEFNSDKKIDVYPKELTQVLTNILQNAKEALMEKSIENKIIKVNISESVDSVSIEICDNAKGIANENCNKIFSPYFSTKKQKDGSGLGLYISKTIVDKHCQGSIEAYNKDDGSCFKITIPLKKKLH